ncbi:carbohydrate porin [Rhodomicrobium lacus]|uniref:carbohydrate porin n=1 Tax=Rhodomicrobium lacus TaxID=2498452 RepID=UPI0026E220D7|nr:carbohydrate porin [Rhodomicrobium lacus]WKW50125.1 carbohydrate porin [Rhodomicrobium lacus]
MSSLRRRRLPITNLICVGTLALVGTTVMPHGVSWAADLQASSAPAAGPVDGLFGSYAVGDPLDDKYLTGGWNGWRSKLVSEGITFRGDYVSETMGVVSGGLDQGFRYSQQVRLGADFDMAKLANWTDGRFHVTLNDRMGRGTSSELAGNRFPIQENYGGQWTRITEASFDQNILDGKVNYKLGYFPMGNDFGMTQLLTNFVNAAFCAHPLAQSANTGWYNYPNARWSAEVTYKVTPEVYVRTGLFQVNPSLGLEKNAFNPFAEGTMGTLLPVEVAYEPGKGTAYPGHYKVGYVYDNSNVKELGLSDYIGQRQGTYIMIDQKITTVAGDDSRGLSVFAQYMWSNPETAVLRDWWSAGLVYQGVFDSRPKDVLAFGYVQASVNEQLLENARIKAAATTGAFSDFTLAEKALELSYTYQINKWASIRPDVQYIMDPGSFYFKHIDDVVAVGMQLKVVF